MLESVRPAGIPISLRATPDELNAFPVVLLREVVEKTTQRDLRRSPDLSFKYVDVSGVSNESLRITDWKEYLGKDAPSRARKVMQAGDVLVATVRPSLRRISQVPGELNGEFCSTAFCVLRADRRTLDPEFLYYACVQPEFTDRLAQHQGGSSYPAVTDTQVLGQFIPFPALHEQRRIARVLSTIQRAVEAQEKIIAAVRELKRSLTRHLFTYGPVPIGMAAQVRRRDTDIGPVPEHWDVIALGDIARIGNGSTPRRTDRRYWENGTVPWLTSAKVYDGTIRQADEFVTETALRECHLPLVPVESLVVAITGQGKTLGNAAILKIQTAVSQHLAYITLNGTELMPEFALAYLRSRYDYLQSSSRAGGSTKGALTCGFLKQFSMPKPPLNEQREIASMISASGEKYDVEMKRLAALTDLFDSALHQLLTGKLRVPESVEAN